MSYQVASGSRPPQPVEMSAQQAYDQFWPRQQEDMRCLEAGAFKQQELPLARYIHNTYLTKPYHYEINTVVLSY